MSNRPVLLALLSLALPSLTAAQAPAPRMFSACYVPAVGAIYLIKETGLPGACLSPNHVEITWNEGVQADGGTTTAKLADGAVTTVKLADGAVTAAKLSTDVANAIVSDGSITPAKLSFDPATQVELDEHAHAAAGINNTRVGNNALISGTAANNTALGSNALRLNTTGQQNVAVGAGALSNNLNGGSNTAVGTRSLFNSTDGSNNTAVGTAALDQNATGSLNTAVGTGALAQNTTAGENTAVGTEALRQNTTAGQNTAFGRSALRDHVTGELNTAVGSFSMSLHTDGASNTALGQATLGVLTTGSNNTALGRNAGVALASGSNNLYVANDGVASEDNTTRIGGAQTRAFFAGVNGVGVSGGVAVMVDANGQLGNTLSSQRYKKDVGDMGTASAQLMKLRPVVFRYRTQADSALQYGLIAEEVAAVFPELVVRGKSGDVETVRYDLLSSLLLNEFQRQERELAALKRAVAALSARR
jgi:hypothetical protein